MNHDGRKFTLIGFVWRAKTRVVYTFKQSDLSLRCSPEEIRNVLSDMFSSCVSNIAQHYT